MNNVCLDVIPYRTVLSMYSASVCISVRSRWRCLGVVICRDCVKEGGFLFSFPRLISFWTAGGTLYFYMVG